MKIHEFTVPELDHFRKMCNFTEEERFLFEQRARGKTLVQAQMAMHEFCPCSESKINRISKAVNRKILKVL